ncbi:sugar O-acetyltransferase [Nocardioides daejeonensis]|uniref:sugar O-acetyltransferase n=1 Tax=Nocardioides daejeonensis TaxID=1046556 RepID=UPI0013A565A0|nr:sugar O-acetyltransferase [Nocardioides daejeonensis]
MTEPSARERMLAGELYLASDPELVAAATRAAALADQFNAPGTDPVRRDSLLRELLGRVGDQVMVRAPLYVDYGTQPSLGDRVFVNYGLTALDCAAITVGDDTLIGPHVQLLTPTHPLDPEVRRSGLESAHPITIGENVWIGGNATVLPGVTIGDHAVVGAGAVVTRDIPARTVVAGTPARVIRTV